MKPSTPSRSLYTAPMLGGTPRLLVKDVDSPITFSPDGKKFAYLREHHDTPNFDLFLMNSDGTPDRTLFSNVLISTDSAVPAWLPDGKTIVIPIVQTSKGSLGGLLSVDVATGKREEMEVVSKRMYYEPAWLPGADGLVVTAIAGTSQSVSPPSRRAELSQGRVPRADAGHQRLLPSERFRGRQEHCGNAKSFCLRIGRGAGSEAG